MALQKALWACVLVGMATPAQAEITAGVRIQTPPEASSPTANSVSPAGAPTKISLPAQSAIDLGRGQLYALNIAPSALETTESRPVLAAYGNRKPIDRIDVIRSAAYGKAWLPRKRRPLSNILTDVIYAPEIAVNTGPVANGLFRLNIDSETGMARGVFSGRAPVTGAQLSGRFIGRLEGAAELAGVFELRTDDIYAQSEIARQAVVIRLDVAASSAKLAYADTGRLAAQ